VYLRDQANFFPDRHRKYGDVFRTDLFMSWGVAVCSAEAADEVLRDKQRMFSSMHGWDQLIGAFFGGGLMLRDFDDHRLHRRVLQEAFKKPAIRGYLDTMNPIIAEQVDAWDRRKDFRLFPAMKKLTLDLAGQVFTGVSPGKKLDRVNRAFIDMIMAGMAVVRRPIPGLAHWRGLRGRAVLEELFDELIERQDETGTDMHLLAHLCRAVSPDGERLTHDEIVDHMIFMMLAAHDTTTSALTNLCWMLAENPDWQERLRGQFAELATDELAYEQLDELTDIDHALLETLRLFPPVTAIPRLAMEDWEVEGHTVPADTVVWVSTHVIQRREDYWTEPERFDPDRFGPDRQEHRRHPGQFNPYSSGPHICLGMRFSKVQVKAVLNRLLRDYRLELPDGAAPSLQLVPLPRPDNELPMRLERLASPWGR
jgi:cytochrome P450